MLIVSAYLMLNWKIMSTTMRLNKVHNGNIGREKLFLNVKEVPKRKKK
jgi:hypothetical protein